MMTKIREGYKETEIGVIPEDWECRKLSSISTLIDGDRGKNYPSPNELVDEGILFLSTSNIKENKFDTLTTKFITKEKFESLGKGKLEQKDLIITLRGTLGSIMLFESNDFDTAFINAQMMIIRSNNLVDYKYLYQCMVSNIIKNQINTNSTGSAQPQLTKKVVSDLLVPVPCKEEQQRIAEILSTTDSHIEKLDKTIEDYQLLKRGMMKKLLTEGIGHTEFKETEIGRIPKEWEVKRLDECFEFYGGYTASRAQLTDEGRLYLHYGDIHLRIRSYIDTNEDSRWMPRYNVEKEKNGASLDTGDIVFADASEDYEGVGKSVVIIKGKEEIVAGLHTIVGKDINDTFDLNYKRYFLGADYVRNQFRRLATGAKVYGISKGNIGQILVSIPCKEEQCVIGKTLARLERHIELLSNEKEELFLLKKPLMDKLLTGKVRVM